jgi:hypothetical protein
MQTERLLSSRVVAPAAFVGYASLVVIGIAWWVVNLATLSEYGDTNHYFQLATSLRVEHNRTLFYPLLLRALQSIAGSLNARTELLVYFLQTATALLSVAYLGRGLWDVTAATERFAGLARVPPARRRLVIAVSAVVVVTEPLVNHFALSVMTDSLAASFAAAGVGSLVRVTALGDTRLRTATLGWLAIAAASFMRAERVIVFVAVIAGILAILAVCDRCARPTGIVRPPRRRLRTIALLTVLLVTPSAAVIAFNRVTQKTERWPPRTPRVALFLRTAYPRLAAIRPLLSTEAQAVVSAGDAIRFDSNFNQYLTLVPELRRRAGGTDRLVDEISRVALRHRWADIVRATAFDALCYTVPVIAYPMDVALATRRGASHWTASRMRMAHPSLTSAYLMVATTVLIGVQLPLLIGALIRGEGRDSHVMWAAALSVGVAAANGLVYALGTGLQNVRYALPAYVLLYAMIVWANAAVLARIGPARSEPIRGTRSPAESGGSASLSS